MSLLKPELTEEMILDKFPGYFKEMLNPELDNPEKEKLLATHHASKHLQPFVQTIVHEYFRRGGREMDATNFAVLQKNSVRFVADLSSTLAKAPDNILLGMTGFLWSSVWSSLEKEALSAGDKRLAEISHLNATAINNTIAAMVRANKI